MPIICEALQYVVVLVNKGPYLGLKQTIRWIVSERQTQQFLGGKAGKWTEETSNSVEGSREGSENFHVSSFGSLQDL